MNRAPASRWDASPVAISYAASALLAERLQPDHVVLELGSGYSTLFLMRRVRRVVSLEHDRGWLEWTRIRADDNVELVHASPEPVAAYLAPLAALTERFDVVMVDGVHRNEAFEAALPLLTAYAQARHKPRKLRRLYDRRGAMMQRLIAEYRASVESPDAPHTDSTLERHR